jgi:hypothetical protein
MKRTALKRKTPLKAHKRLNPISKKLLGEYPIYRQLIARLRELCDNKSELDGSNPDWQSSFRVDPHHINGRDGDLFLDPFNIIMLTRHQHDIEGGQIPGEKVGKEKLLATVYALRIKQGFKPTPKEARWLN